MQKFIKLYTWFVYLIVYKLYLTLNVTFQERTLLRVYFIYLTIPPRQKITSKTKST